MKQISLVFPVLKISKYWKAALFLKHLSMEICDWTSYTHIGVCVSHSASCSAALSWRDTVLPDGVRIRLDWKDKTDHTDITQIVFIVHGLGGGSSAYYARTLTEYCLVKGYRSVVYNRRGHGGMSLLPQAESEVTGAPQFFPRHWDFEDMYFAEKHVFFFCVSLCQIICYWLFGWSQCDCKLPCSQRFSNPIIGSSSAW